MADQALFTSIELHLRPTDLPPDLTTLLESLGGVCGPANERFRVVTVPVETEAGAHVVDWLVGEFFEPTSELAPGCMTIIARGGQSDIMDAREIVASVAPGTSSVVAELHRMVVEAMAKRAVDDQPVEHRSIPITLDMVRREETGMRRALGGVGFPARASKKMQEAAERAWDRVHQVLTLQACGALAFALRARKRALPDSMNLIPTGVLIATWLRPDPEGDHRKWCEQPGGERCHWAESPNAKDTVLIASARWFESPHLYQHIVSQLAADDFVTSRHVPVAPLLPMTQWEHLAVDVDRTVSVFRGYRAEHVEADEAAMLENSPWMKRPYVF